MTNPCGWRGDFGRRLGAWLAVLLLFQSVLSAMALAGSPGAAPSHGLCLANQAYSAGAFPASGAPSAMPEKCCAVHCGVLYSALAGAAALLPARLAYFSPDLRPYGRVWRAPAGPGHESAFPRAPPGRFV